MQADGEFLTTFSAATSHPLAMVVAAAYPPLFRTHYRLGLFYYDTDLEALITYFGPTYGWRVIKVPPALEANTAGSGAPNVLIAAERGGTFTNEGTTAQNYHTLPGAVADLEFTFIVQDADGIRVIAASGDTIRLATSVSAAAGHIDSTEIGASVTLKAVNATEWIATSIVGTWSVT